MRGQLTEIQRQKQINSRLKNENAKLREGLKRMAVLEEENRVLKSELEKAFLLIEELQRMVFGKGKKKRDDNNDHPNISENKQSTKVDRKSSSYRRENPKDEDVNKEEFHCEENCPHCQNKLNKLKQLEFFTEDVLSPERWFKVLKQITRKWITTGYCSDCKKRVTPIEIPKQKVTLGENIRQLIVFQSTVQQLSYSQIIDFTEGILHLKLSQGEITNILESQANKLEPSYLAIQNEIRLSKAVHMDETGWKTVKGNQGNYAWVACNANSDDVLYSLGQSRGKGNIEKMLGEKYSGTGITDDYGAYKNSFKKGSHALCWAHPHRKIRDLKNSESLSDDKKKHCKKASEEFSMLYEKIRKVNEKPFIKKEREEKTMKLSKLFDKFAKPHPDDPEKLKQIKKRLTEQKECYFVCLLVPNISPDNNKAERALRHLVIKRKKSFGSKTQKGANMLSIIYSVVMSLWRKSKQDFFSSYSMALMPAGGQ